MVVDGYYNDSQNSSLYFLRELQKYSPQTSGYLIIGPYGHFGAQIGGEPEIYGYSIDSTAMFDIKKITYQWFDYILKDGTKPEFLKDKINYQVMGTNQWKHAPSIDKMNNDVFTFYLSNEKSDMFYSLNAQKPVKKDFLVQQVDFADRIIVNNIDYYQAPIIKEQIDTNSGFIFVSDPIDEPILVNGSFSGQLNLSINKKDVDVGITLYELLPDGTYFHLSYYIGRASYAKDITKRKLLKPNKITKVPFSNTHLISKQLEKGSRLVVVIDVNRNPFSQLNYGTGKDVSIETIADAQQVLEIKWYNDSFVRIPVLK